MKVWYRGNTPSAPAAMANNTVKSHGPRPNQGTATVPQHRRAQAANTRNRAPEGDRPRRARATARAPAARHPTSAAAKNAELKCRASVSEYPLPFCKNIGNHTRSHLGLTATSLNRLRGELDHINSRCAEHGIPKPVSFAYPGNAIHPAALDILRGAGITWARRGAQPEFTYESGRGVAYDPRHDDPRLIPTAGDARPDWTLENLQQAVAGARDGRIAVLQFHGAPDLEHPWVHTPPERFTEYMTWLKDNGYHAIALRDLARFIDPADAPLEPMAVIERRQAALSGQ